MQNDEIEYTICGCVFCRGGDAIYDGTIIYKLTNGALVNRFASEGSRRERRIDRIIADMKMAGTP